MALHVGVAASWSRIEAALSLGGWGLLSFVLSTQHEDPLSVRHLLIDGVASIDDDPEWGQKFMDQLFYKYTGAAGFQLNENHHVLVTVDITRVSGVGPWHTGKTTSYGTPI